MQTIGAQFVAIGLEIGKYQVTSETYNLLGQRVLITGPILEIE
jgi:hypothetical protein